MRIEYGEVTKAKRRLSWLRAAALAAVALPCLGAAGTIVYRVGHWRGQSDTARAIALRSDDEHLRTQAMVGAFNDARLTIDALRTIAREGGTAGRRAETLLRYLHEASR